MTLWFVLALMTAAAIFAVLWPLSRATKLQTGSDLAVYRDQLDELDRDRAAGLVGETEAQAAKVEVSRRLIAAADARRTRASIASVSARRCGAGVRWLSPHWFCCQVLQPHSILRLGSPQLPGQPLEARLRAAHQDSSIESLVSQVEAHLEHNPDDARGYEVLAPVYMRLGRFADAVSARRRLLTLSGESAERQSDVGEALAAAANGVVTADAKAAFERALVLDPNELKAKFFIGLAAEQDGDRAKAAATWRGMLEAAPADAPWVSMVREALARVGGTPPIVDKARPERRRCRRRW